MSSALYRWQCEALQQWRSHGHRGIVEAVTGAGKTRLGIEAIEERLRGGGRSVVVVPGRTLLDQWARLLARRFPETPVGRLGDVWRDDPRTHDVLVATVNLARAGALGDEAAPALIVADECHRYGSDVNRLALPPRFEWRMGLSATRERTDGAHRTVVEPYFEGVCYRYGYEQALADGVIAPFTVALIPVAFSAEERDLYEYLDEKVRRARRVLVEAYGLPAEPFGVFIRAVNELRLSGGRREAIAAGRYLSSFNRRRALLAETRAKLEGLARLEGAIGEADRVLVFTQTVAAAGLVTGELEDLGFEAGSLHARMRSAERQEVLERFRRGRLRVLVSPQILDEGLDVPDADLGVIVAASRQRRQMVQRMGRCLRPKAGRRRARFAILYVEGTSEDPRLGAHETFLDEIVGPADEVRRFALDDPPEAIGAFLSPWRAGSALSCGLMDNAAAEGD